MATSSTSLPQKALYKCWAVWENDWKKTFYSYDSSGRYDVENPDEYGLKGLKKRIIRQYPDRLKRAIIYDNHTGRELERYQGGQWVPSTTTE